MIIIVDDVHSIDTFYHMKTFHYIFGPKYDGINTHISD